jgi:hypothetical protein
MKNPTPEIIQPITAKGGKPTKHIRMNIPDKNMMKSPFEVGDSSKGITYTG